MLSMSREAGSRWMKAIDRMTTRQTRRRMVRKRESVKEGVGNWRDMPI